MLAYLWPQRKVLSGAVACMIIYSIFHAATIFMIKPVIDSVFVASPQTMTLTIPYVDWKLPFDDRLQFLRFIALSIAVGYLFKSAADFGQQYLITMAGMRILQSIRKELFGKYTRIPLEFLAGERAGKILSISLNDVGLIYSAILRMVTDTVLQPFIIAFLVIVAIAMVPLNLSIAAFVVLPFIGGLIAYFGRKMKRATHHAQEKIEDITQVLQEKVGGMKIVRVFGQEDTECDKFGREVDSYYRWSMKQAKISSLSGPIMMFLGGLGAALAIYYGGYLVVTQKMTAGAFGAFITAVISIYRPIKSLTTLNNVYQQGAAAGERMFAFLDMPEAASVDVGRPASFERELAFDGVRFRYEGTDVDVLSNVDFRVKKGEHVAFVGISGIGKSTLLMLIPRLLEPTAGRILLDGEPLSEVSPRTLRNLLAAVVQDVVLFNDTVSANILYGRPDATREEVEVAARAADAHEFILALPRQYDTVIGERGDKLSGGQRQRLAIARAFLKNAPILILDEATSSLDAQSEREIQGALERLSAGRTTLTVAHRLSTVRSCDRIYVMENGRIADAGTHDDLMTRCESYRRAVTLQTL